MVENGKNSKTTTVAIVGGGNSAHILIALLGATGHRVNLLTRRPSDWQKNVKVELRSMDGEVLDMYTGTISKASCDPYDIIPEADVIVLCMPVHTYRDALHQVAPHINRNKEVFVGTVYGQAGFNWMVHEAERQFGLTNVVAFAIGCIPWICRTLEYGSAAVNYGCKKVNIVAVTPSNRFDRLNEIFLEDICYKWFGTGHFVQACSFLSLTLSVDNQIIHPARCYGLWKRYGGRWKTEADIPFFYKEFDQISADTMKKLDEEYSKIRAAVRKHFPSRDFQYMLDFLSLDRLQHESTNENIQKAFQESKQLGLIKPPTKQLASGEHVLDIQSRYFTDDIPYGLLIAKWVAEELKVLTPFIDEVIDWAQTLRGWKFVKNNRIDVDFCLADKFHCGIPPVYGITSVDGVLD